MSALEQELKQLLIEVLNLEDVSVEQIDSQAPLFGDGLGLDSIDALEFGVSHPTQVRRSDGRGFGNHARAFRLDREPCAFHQRWEMSSSSPFAPSETPSIPLNRC